MDQKKAMVPLSTNRVMELAKIGKEYSIDSRVIAKGMGLQHESFIKLIHTYQNRLEKWGVLRFEIGKPLPGSLGGRPENYVLLNRNQAMFALTLSRNTEQVVDFKFDLIEAFDLVTSGKLPKQPRHYVAEHRFLPPAQKDHFIFHVIDLRGSATGREVQQYTHWYTGKEARKRMAELEEAGLLEIIYQSKRVIRYARPLKRIA